MSKAKHRDEGEEHERDRIVRIWWCTRQEDKEGRDENYSLISVLATGSMVMLFTGTDTQKEKQTGRIGKQTTWCQILLQSQSNQNNVELS